MRNLKNAKILRPDFGRRPTKPLVDESSSEAIIISTSAMKRAQLLQEEHLRVNGERLDVLELAKELSFQC